MTTKELASALGFTTVVDGTTMEREIEGGYVSDLLSDVMGNINEGMVWLTVQVHRNTVAVAALKEVAAVVLVSGARMEEDVILEAKNQGVAVLSTEMPAFEAAAKIYNMIN